jgi:hypothetical protein
MSLDDKLGMDEFLTKIATKNYRVNNFYQANEGTWFISVGLNGIYYYGRDKDLGICLRQAWRQVSGEGRAWVSYEDLIKNPNKMITKKKPLPRVRMNTRVRLRG